MKIDEVKVSAGRTFNHPYESYSNLRCDVHLGAKLDDGEEPLEAAKQLQARAEELAEGHKVALLKNIEDLQRIAQASTEISALERRMQEADARLKELRRSVSAYQSEPAGPFQLTGSDRRDEQHEQEDDDVRF